MNGCCRAISPLPGNGVRRAKAVLFQWVKDPPGDLFQPEAPGATIEATKMVEAFGLSLSRCTVTAHSALFQVVS